MSSERVNQKARTRRALLEAGLDLMRAGNAPTIAEVADAAKVSVATAYRYFPNPQALWVEANQSVFAPPPPDETFARADTPSARVEAMVRTVGWSQYDDEALWRNVLRATLTASPDATIERTGQRMYWIEQALDVLDDQFDPGLRHRLTMALALVFGTESIITLRDVCGLDVDEARAVSLWAARALVHAAEVEATAGINRAATRR
jgi:AcrR family transcriptional regulator